MRYWWLCLGAVLFWACGEDVEQPGDAMQPDAQGELSQEETAGPVARCGNGIVDEGEACDDGYRNGSYGHCLSDCSAMGPHCGDGILEEDYELCDDGADNGKYGRCAVACDGIAGFCGNGFVEEEAGEVCDDGVRNGDYGYCARDCKQMGPVCGDGFVDAPFELCDLGDLNGIGDCPEDCGGILHTCGDGKLDPGEVCDDGADNGTYGHCAVDCLGMYLHCGDGLLTKPERCDDGEANGSYGHCNADCTGLGEHCGDGIVQAEEVCDDGPLNGQPGHCRPDCRGVMLDWTVSDQVAQVGDACEDGGLFAKYMTYRTRFYGDGTAANPGFVAKGEGPGRAMPAVQRRPNDSCASYWELDGCRPPQHEGGRGVYKWGDGTIWQGAYLEHIALEYAMFSHMGLPVEETLQNLREALLAVIRVDLAAERYFGVPPVRDGFYLRDDVPQDMPLNEDGSFRWPRDDGYAGYGCVAAATVCETPTVDDGSYTSQDQTVGLISGLAAIKRFVPDGIVVAGMDIQAEVRQIAHDLVAPLRENRWHIRDPNGNTPPDAWGGDVTGFSNQIAKIANYIVEGRLGVDDYRDFRSRSLGAAAWTGIDAIWNQTKWYNRSMAFKLAAASGSWNLSKNTRKAVEDNNDYYALLYALFQGGTPPEPWSDWRYEAMLEMAPCGGPCVGLEGRCESTMGWRGESRVIWPGSQEGPHYFHDAEFNGMDYLSMYAVYYLYKQGQMGFDAQEVAGSCESPLEAVLAGRSESYDPNDACVGLDMDRKFCERKWSGWLDDAYGGKVQIVTAGKRWNCEPGLPCTLTPGAETDGDDLIIGTPGNDRLKGGDGNDCIIGLGGDDVLEGNAGHDWLDGGPGNDSLYGESLGWLNLFGGNDILYGGEGDDLLKGGPGHDWLYGGPGNDILEGNGGRDALYGGPGNDELYGGDGQDYLVGGEGDDWIEGGGGDDALFGGPGDDRLDGGGGDDRMDAGPGRDFLRGGSGDDVLSNPTGPSRLCGNGGSDVIWGSWEGDSCYGGGTGLGARDRVQGCEDGSASYDDCTKRALKNW